MQRMTRFALVFLAVTVAGAAAAHAGDIAVHGTVSQGYFSSSEYNSMTPDTKAGTFAVNEALVNFSLMVDDRTRIGVQFLGRDLGRIGNGNVTLDWAFGDYRWKDEIGFRAGKIKTPLGLYNKTRDVDAVRTSVLMPQSVYNEDFREVTTAFQGVSVYGDVPLAGSSSFEYEAFYGTVEMDQNQFLGSLVAPPGAPQLHYGVEPKHFTGISGIWNTPLEGLRVAGTVVALEATADGSYQVGQPVPLDIDLELALNSYYVLSAEYLRDRLALAGEFTRIDAEFKVKNNLMPGTTELADKRGGWYLQGSWRFSDLFEFGTYYSVFHPDWSDRSGDGNAIDHTAWQKDLALTGRFDVTGNWILKAEYHFMNGTGQLEPGWNTDSTYEEETWGMFAAKSTFYF